MEQGAQHTCAVCEVPAHQRCSGCKELYVCSLDHLTQLWPVHRTSCKAPRDAFVCPPLTETEGGTIFSIPPGAVILDKLFGGTHSSVLSYIQFETGFSGS
ncbi:hypothetical protein JCM10207_007717 [Rhodosporidiobolus poonsookiae]